MLSASPHPYAPGFVENRPSGTIDDRCGRAPFRKIARDINEEARDYARSLKGTPEFEQSSDQRKKVEMRFAHLKVQHRFERMRLRGLTGARRVHPRGHRAEPQDACKSNLAAAEDPVGGVSRLTALVGKPSIARTISSLPTGAATNPSTKRKLKALTTSSPTLSTASTPSGPDEQFKRTLWLAPLPLLDFIEMPR